MAHVTCKCGARFSIPEAWAGRRAKCRKCNGVIEIPAHLSEVDTLALALDDASPTVASSSPSAVHTATEAPAFRPPRVIIEAADDEPAWYSLVGIPAYIRDCARSLLFFLNIKDILVLIVLAIALAGLVFTLVLFSSGRLYAMLLAIILFIPIATWVTGYFLEIITYTAGGESDLPDLNWTDGVMSEVFSILGGGFVAFMCAFAPYIAAIIYLVMTDADPADTTNKIIEWGTWGYAVFMLPITMLITAIGGASTLVRLDLIVRTILATAPAYVVVVLVSVVALPAIRSLFESLSSVGLQHLPAWVTWTVPYLLSAYMLIVYARVVGLYYRHFKDRFAWNWG